jgi:hypothetical protein
LDFRCGEYHIFVMCCGTRGLICIGLDEKGPSMDRWGAPHVDMWRPREVGNREYMQCIMPAGRDSWWRKREGIPDGVGKEDGRRGTRGRVPRTMYRPMGWWLQTIMVSQESGTPALRGLRRRHMWTCGVHTMPNAGRKGFSCRRKREGIPAGAGRLAGADEGVCRAP